MWGHYKVNTELCCVSRYDYRFVCDVQSLLGYTPEELHAMVDLQPIVKKEDEH